MGLLEDDDLFSEAGAVRWQLLFFLCCVSRPGAGGVSGWGVYLRSGFLVGEGSEGDFFDTHDCCLFWESSVFNGDGCMLQNSEETMAGCVWTGGGGGIGEI